MIEPFDFELVGGSQLAGDELQATYLVPGAFESEEQQEDIIVYDAVLYDYFYLLEALLQVEDAD